MQESYYLKKIKEDFTRRSRKNPAYSLRAYAKYLGIHPSTLSHILLGKRTLPKKSSQAVLEKLRLDSQERTRFKTSLPRKKLKIDSIKLSADDSKLLSEEAHFQIIAEWEYYAVLTLFDCTDFNPTLTQIQKRLNLSAPRAKAVLQKLLESGLLHKGTDGKIQKSQTQVKTTEDVVSKALRSSHLETLDLGKRKLDEVAIEFRDFSSAMLAISLQKIPEAKIIIREFREKLVKLMEDGDRSEVYQIAIQLYPLTQIQAGSEPL